MTKYIIFRFSLLIICLGAIFNSAFGQNRIQLSNKLYKQLVIENNHQILAASASVEAANSNIDVKRKDLFPSLDFVASNRYFDERVTPEGMPALRDNFYNLGLNLSQNIYSGGIVQKNKRLAEIYANEARAGKDLTENDILYLASLTYWTAVSAEEELVIWKEYRERFQAFVNTIEDRVNEAIVGKNELLTTQVQLNEIDLQILSAEKTAEMARLNMKKLARIDVGEGISLMDSIVISETLPDTTNVLEHAIQNRPEVYGTQQQVLASEQMEKIVGARYAPRFGVSVGGNYSNGLIDKPDGDFHYNVLATASLPITRWGKKRDEKTVQQFYTQSAREQLMDQHQNVKFDIAKAYYNLEQSLRQVTLSRSATEEARENLQIYIDRYDEGLSSIVEVTEAQIFLQKALVMLFSYRTNYQFSLVEYDKALGMLSN